MGHSLYLFSISSLHCHHPQNSLRLHTLNRHLSCILFRSPLVLPFGDQSSSALLFILSAVYSSVSLCPGLQLYSSLDEALRSPSVLGRAFSF